MLRKTDGLQFTDIVCVLRKEQVLVYIKELLGLLRIKGCHHVEERVDKERPQNAPKFGLSKDKHCAC
jgi:hypothetical protein